MVFGYYYGSIVYIDMASQEFKTKMFVDGIMVVSKTDFEKWAVKIRHK